MNYFPEQLTDDCRQLIESAKDSSSIIINPFVTRRTIDNYILSLKYVHCRLDFLYEQRDILLGIYNDSDKPILGLEIDFYSDRANNVLRIDEIEPYEIYYFYDIKEEPHLLRINKFNSISIRPGTYSRIYGIYATKACCPYKFSFYDCLLFSFVIILCFSYFLF